MLNCLEDSDMRIFWTAVCLSLLSGCAFAPRDTVALSGTIDARREAKATSEPTPILRPGTGGAIGGAMMGLMNASNNHGPYHIYKIHMLNGEYLEVPAYAEVELGTCVDVMVAASKSNIYSFWNAGDVELRPSAACQKIAQK
jgi:hypothetical protein